MKNPKEIPDPVQVRVLKPCQIKTDDFCDHRVSIFVDEENHVKEVKKLRIIGNGG